MKKIFTILCVAGSVYVNAQCNINANAVSGLTLNGPGMTSTPMGVAYNPGNDVYYSVGGGGSGMTLVTYDNAGVQVSTASPTNFDHRGLWWNPILNQLESNAYNTGGVRQLDIAANGYGLATGTNLLAANQPDAQSMGTLDYDDNEIIYYNNGRVYRKDRTTNASISDYLITGLPVASSNLTTNFIGYTGCVGKEIVVYDNVLKAAYLIDKSTGSYVGTSIMPAGAPATNGYETSYSNGMLFLEGTSQWFGYYLFEQCSDSTSAFTVEACDTYTVPSGDSTYTVSGVYNDTIPNSTGCDSIMTITVNITTLDLNTTITDFTISADHATGTYQWINCSDNLPIAGATSQTYTAIANGDYAVILTDGPCSDTTVCVTIAGVGIDETSEMGITVFPNPTHGEFYISSSANTVSVTVYSVDGKIIINNLKVTGENQSIHLGDVETGIYFVEVSNDSNKEIIRLIVK